MLGISFGEHNHSGGRFFVTSRILYKGYVWTPFVKVKLRTPKKDRRTAFLVAEDGSESEIEFCDIKKGMVIRLCSDNPKDHLYRSTLKYLVSKDAEVGDTTLVWGFEANVVDVVK